MIDLFCAAPPCFYFYGYHKLPEGIILINEIKSKMNNFRLTTFVDKKGGGFAAPQQILINNFNFNPYADLVKIKKELINLFNLKVNLEQSITNNNNITGLRRCTQNYSVNINKFKHVFNFNIYKQDQLLPLLLMNFIKYHLNLNIEGITLVTKILLLFSLPSPACASMR